MSALDNLLKIISPADDAAYAAREIEKVLGHGTEYGGKYDVEITPDDIARAEKEFRELKEAIPRIEAGIAAFKEFLKDPSYDYVRKAYQDRIHARENYSLYTRAAYAEISDRAYKISIYYSLHGEYPSNDTDMENL